MAPKERTTMAKQPSTHQDPYLAAFQALDKNGTAQDPQWARDLRKGAIQRFAELGLPTARRGNEEWKYTNVGPIAAVPFQPLLTPAPFQASARGVRRFTLGPTQGHRLVFVDGSYVEGLSSAGSLPEGVCVANLTQAMSSRADLMEKHLARHADYSTNAFTALNTAFLHDGAFVHIPEGVTVRGSLELLFLSTSHPVDAALQPRVLLVAGRHSKATVIESYGALREGRYLTNAVSEVVLGDGAEIEHYRVQQESDQAFHIHSTQVSLGRDATFWSVTADLGGGLTRNNLDVLMADEGASCMLNGLYIVGGSQHVDNQVIVDHAKPHTTTRELYKGILDGKSRAVFHGSIVVRQDAQKVDARQEDRNLLLSDQAEADTKPAFWIYADDVKCSHGAACGKLDEEALFYLRSRGIEDSEARRFLTRGFLSEVISSARTETVRGRLDRLVARRLDDLQP